MTCLVVERLKKGKKQYQVAADLGVTPTYICKLERGKEVPNDEFAKKLEKYYGKPIKYLLQTLK